MSADVSIDLRELRSALIANADIAGVAVFPALTPVWQDAVAIGRAYTVQGVGGDNLALHHALASAPPGAVIVASVGGDRGHGHWGDLMTVAARHRRLEGLVIDGSIRDRMAISEQRFPVFHYGLAARPAHKLKPGVLGAAVKWSPAGEIRTGDLVVADEDGIVAIPGDLVEEVLIEVAHVVAREQRVRERLHAGVSTLDALGLPVATGDVP